MGLYNRHWLEYRGSNKIITVRLICLVTTMAQSVTITLVTITLVTILLVTIKQMADTLPVPNMPLS